MSHRLRFSIISLFLALLALPVFRLEAATIYRPGDIAENFGLVNRATRQPMRLSDFAGKIVVLDWFAWWCPFCQAAAPQLYSGIDQYYAARNGNPGGIPVVHVGINLQAGQEPQTQNFATNAGFDVVLEDFTRTVAGRFGSGGQPIFGIVNCVTNSPSHAPYEVLYVQDGYGQTTFPVGAFRTAIDAVRAAPVPITVSPPVASGDGIYSLTVTAAAGRPARLESSTNLVDWQTVQRFVATNGTAGLSVTNQRETAGRYFRVATP